MDFRIQCRRLDRAVHWCSWEAPRYIPFPSDQAIKPSAANPARPDTPALQRLRTAPGSIVPAGLEVARLSRCSFGLRAGHEGLVELLIGAIVASMRSFSPAISDGLELVGSRTPEWEGVVPKPLPARHVGQRHGMLAIGARSRYVTVAARLKYHVGKGAEEEVGMDAARVCASQSGCIPYRSM
jgi:hypothetical protein